MKIQKKKNLEGGGRGERSGGGVGGRGWVGGGRTGGRDRVGGQSGCEQ